MEARRAHNPEVVGSSPASATIKAPVFELNAGVFLTFAVYLKMPMVPFRVTFGSLGLKTAILGHAVRVSGRSFLCLFPEQNLGDALGSLGLVLLDDVGILLDLLFDGGCRVLVPDFHAGLCGIQFAQSTHSRVDQMLNQDYTAKVLNLEDVIITNVENISDVLHIYLELPRQKHRYPACGALTDRIHDYRMQTIKDIPMGGETLLHLRKRRYRCSCGKRFFEKNSFLPRYYRIASRLVAAIITAFRDTVSAARIGTQYHVSGTTAMRYFKCVGFRPTELPEVLSLDEFKGNSGGQKYNSIVADRYHVIRQAYWAMERVRKNEQNKPSKQFRKYFKKSRCLLIRKPRLLYTPKAFHTEKLFILHCQSSCRTRKNAGRETPWRNSAAYSQPSPGIRSSQGLLPGNCRAG